MPLCHIRLCCTASCQVVYTPVDWIQQPLKAGVYKDTKALQLEQAGAGLINSMGKAAAGVTAGEAAGHWGREQIIHFDHGCGALLLSQA